MNIQKISHYLGTISVPFRTQVLLFVAGFGILALEILGIRILAPFVGTTISVWAALIGVTLLGGSIGYYSGGLLADYSQRKVFFVILASSAGLLIGAIPFLREGISFLISDTSYTVGALVSSLLLFLFPVTLLSMLITYAIRLQVTSLSVVGQMHGDLYAIATIGSIAGVFGTSYLLVPFYTLTHILVGLGACIIAVGIGALRT